MKLHAKMRQETNKCGEWVQQDWICSNVQILIRKGNYVGMKVNSGKFLQGKQGKGSSEVM